jgi:hypothetical protein
MVLAIVRTIAAFCSDASSTATTRTVSCVVGAQGGCARREGWQAGAGPRGATAACRPTPRRAPQRRCPRAALACTHHPPPKPHLAAAHELAEAARGAGGRGAVGDAHYGRVAAALVGPPRAPAALLLLLLLLRGRTGAVGGAAPGLLLLLLLLLLPRRALARRARPRQLLLLLLLLPAIGRRVGRARRQRRARIRDGRGGAGGGRGERARRARGTRRAQRRRRAARGRARRGPRPGARAHRCPGARTRHAHRCRSRRGQRGAVGRVEGMGEWRGVGSVALDPAARIDAYDAPDSLGL